MAAQKLALHICWQDPKTTNMVVEIVCEIIADTNEEEFPNLFNLLSILVNMRDGLEKYRSEKISYCFMRAVAENIQYSSMCIKCLEFLTQVKIFLFGYCALSHSFQAKFIDASLLCLPALNTLLPYKLALDSTPRPLNHTSFA
jgi:hypothetical protein